MFSFACVLNLHACMHAVTTSTGSVRKLCFQLCDHVVSVVVLCLSLPSCHHSCLLSVIIISFLSCRKLLLWVQQHEAVRQYDPGTLCVFSLFLSFRLFLYCAQVCPVWHCGEQKVFKVSECILLQRHMSEPTLPTTQTIMQTNTSEVEEGVCKIHRIFLSRRAVRFAPTTKERKRSTF